MNGGRGVMTKLLAAPPAQSGLRRSRADRACRSWGQGTRVHPGSTRADATTVGPLRRGLVGSRCSVDGGSPCSGRTTRAGSAAEQGSGLRQRRRLVGPDRFPSSTAVSCSSTRRNIYDNRRIMQQAFTRARLEKTVAALHPAIDSRRFRDGPHRGVSGLHRAQGTDAGISPPDIFMGGRKEHRQRDRLGAEGLRRLCPRRPPR